MENEELLEKEISLEDWAKRHPEANEDVDKTEFGDDLNGPPLDPLPDQNSWFNLTTNLIGQIIIGIIVFVITAVLTPHVGAWLP